MEEAFFNWVRKHKPLADDILICLDQNILVLDDRRLSGIYGYFADQAV